MKLSRRLAIIFVAAGVVGLFAIAIIATLTDRQLRPYHSDLPLRNRPFTSPVMVLSPGYRYRIAVGGDGSVPHADCLLGAGVAGVSANCDQYPSALKISWSLRDELGHVIASGTSPDTQSSFDYGKHIEVELGYFSVFRSTNTRLSFNYRLDPAPLASLHPYIVVDAPEALLWFGASETLAGVLFATLACVGAGRLLLTTWRRGEHPAWEE